MNRLTRRDWLTQATAALAAGALASPAQGQLAFGHGRPNIIWVMADDLGYGDLGCYGQDKIATPHLDRMAAEGMLFTQCYAGSTVCAPSRSALMEGLHTGNCRVRGNYSVRDRERVPLLPEDTTVAALLKQAGYRNGLIGKWGLGHEETTGEPRRQGFDYFFGYLDQAHAHNYFPEYLWRNETQVRLEGNTEIAPLVPGEKVTYSHDLFTDEAVQFIQTNQHGPFFLYLAYCIPHAANAAGRHHGPESGEGMHIPSDEPYSEKDWPQSEKNRAAMIHRLDRDMGRLFGTLQELGIDQNTVVFFTSDNGPHKEGGVNPEFFNSSGPLRGIKRDLYDGGIRVPMIVRWPGKIAAGAVNDHIWAFWDFLPTALELAGLPPHERTDGISIVPALMGPWHDQPKHEYLYWEFHEGGTKQAVRMGPWKGVRNALDAPIELYDVTEDIGETRDIAGDHPAIVARIEEIFRVGRTPSADWPLPGDPA